MEGPRLLIALLTILVVLSEVKCGNIRLKEQFENYDDSEQLEKITQNSEEELEHHAVKQKRNPNLQSTLDIKLRLEERKQINLCKFCNKLESRKNLEICKKCFNNSFDNMILGNPIKNSNSNETNIKFVSKLNKSKENEGKNKNLQEANGDIAAENSNIIKSNVSELIKSPSFRGTLETSKTQTITENTVDTAQKMMELKENNSTNYIGNSSDINGESNRLLNLNNYENRRERLIKHLNLQNKNFGDTHDTDHLNLVNKRLKRRKQLRKSEETIIEKNKKENSADLLNQALIENSSKIFDIAPEENDTLEDISDLIELYNKNEPIYEEITEKITTISIPERKILERTQKINNLKLRLANLRQNQKKKSKEVTTTEHSKTTEIYSTASKNNNIDNIYSVRSKYRKQPTASFIYKQDNKFNEIEKSDAEQQDKNFQEDFKLLLNEMNQTSSTEKNIKLQNILENPNRNEELEKNVNKQLEEIFKILSEKSSKINNYETEEENIKAKIRKVLTKDDNSQENRKKTIPQLPLIKDLVAQTEIPFYSSEYYDLDSQEEILKRIPKNDSNLLQKVVTSEPEIKENVTKKAKLIMKLNIPLNTAIKNQYNINRKLYSNNPSLNKEIKENILQEKTKEKLVVTTPIITTQSIRKEEHNRISEEDETSESHNSEEIYDDELGTDDLLDLLQNAEPTAFEAKRVSTRSTKDIPLKNIKPTYFYPTTEKNIENTLVEKENKMLLVHRNKLNDLRNKIYARRKQNLFEKNINMKPEIDKEKYKNFRFPLTIEENATNLQSNNEKRQIEYDQKNAAINTNLKNLEDLLKEHLNSKEREETELNVDRIPNNLRFTENKINLPLILLQNDDGTVEIVLDKAELCTQLSGKTCPYGEKSLCKRKTEDNLTKYPLNIFDILKEKKNKLASIQPVAKNDDTKVQFYKYLINQKLFELFNSLNIPIDSSTELHSYIDDMPDKQKVELKQYLLNSISNSFKTEDLNNIKQDISPKIHATTHSNRLNLKIKSEETPKRNNHFLSDVFKSLIHNQIQKELVNTNVCPTCNKKQCICKNIDKIFFPPDYSSEYSESESRILGKRQNNNKIVTDEDSDNSSDISPHGTVKRRYKIVHNILDWVHDVMVHNNTIVK